MEKSVDGIQETYDRACYLISHSEYTIEANVKTDVDSVVIVPSFITTSGLDEMGREFSKHPFSKLSGGFVVGDY